MSFRFSLAILWLLVGTPLCAFADNHAVVSTKEIFAADNRQEILMRIEAAIAQAQAEHDVIPQSASEEIASKAELKYAPPSEVAAEYKLVNHRMVALLNVWKRSLNKEAANFVHYGVTTVDVYDTLRVIQIRDNIAVLVDEMRHIESALLELAESHRSTVMIGRTIGQHALPITFGKKVAVWAAQNRRNIERLKELDGRIRRMGVLRGAVGTHLGLGEKGIEIERRAAQLLGLGEPEAADWHGARDNFAEYAQILALIAKSYAAIGGEVFRLQMTDLFEVEEKLASSNVGSSTMPHKRNPRKSEHLVHHGRKIPRLAEVLLDDVENVFERDNTSRPNRVLEELSKEVAVMTNDMWLLLSRLVVHKDSMRANLDRTGGLVMAQRIVLSLADDVGREEAEDRVRKAAASSLDGDITFREALLNDETLQPHLEKRLDDLLDPQSYIGLSAEQVDRTIAQIQSQRQRD